MEIFVSLAARSHLDAQTLTKVVGFRVLDFRLLREQAGFAYYAFVAFATDDSGDYDLKVAKLRQQGLASNSYKLANITTIGEGYQSVHEASTAMDKLSPHAKFMSLSAPPPIQSATFPLTDFRIPVSPALQERVDSWVAVQKIAPVRYAVVNPRLQAIEVAFRDPSAHNSDIVQDMLRDSLYRALGDYSAGKDFSVPGRC